MLVRLVVVVALIVVVTLTASLAMAQSAARSPMIAAGRLFEGNGPPFVVMRSPQ